MPYEVPGQAVRLKAGAEGEKHPTHLDVLKLMAEIVFSADNLGRLFESTVRLIHEVVKVERCSILLVDPETADLVLGAEEGLPPEVYHLEDGELGGGVAREVAETGEAVLGKQYRQAGDEREKGYTTDTYVSVPIEGAEGRLGVLNITNNQDRGPLDEQDLEIMKIVGRMLAIKVDRYRLIHRYEHLARELGKTVENLPDGVLAVRRSGDILSSNQQFADLLGWSEVPSGNLKDAASGSEVELLYSLALKAMNSRHEVRMEMLSGMARGRPLRVIAVPVGDQEGRSDEALLILVDLSLREELEHLKRLDEMKNNFISVVSHELRTPLTSIRGATNLLKSSHARHLDEESRNLVNIVANNVERLVSTVNTILDISQLDREGADLNFEEANVAALIELVLSDFQKEIDGRNIQIDWQCPAPLPNIPMDMERMRRALGAVVDNAVKFTSEGGRIEILSERETSHHRSVDYIDIRVRDDGIGISPEYRELVFQKFYQIENPMTRRAGGSGLGLYLTRQIIERHGGCISFEDREQGTGVRIALPVPNK